MSNTTLFVRNGIIVTELNTPERPAKERSYMIERADTGDLTTNVVIITRQQWETIAEYITADCGPECESPRLDKPLPPNWLWSDSA